MIKKNSDTFLTVRLVIGWYLKWVCPGPREGRGPLKGQFHKIYDLVAARKFARIYLEKSAHFVIISVRLFSPLVLLIHTTVSLKNLKIIRHAFANKLDFSTGNVWPSHPAQIWISASNQKFPVYFGSWSGDAQICSLYIIDGLPPINSLRSS